MEGSRRDRHMLIVGGGSTEARAGRVVRTAGVWAIAIAIAVAGSANAGVGHLDSTGSKLVYEDLGPASNAVTVSADPSGLVIQDAAGVTTGPGCEAVDARTLRCQALPELRLSTGAGDDRVEIEASAQPYVWAELGDGNDTLHAAGPRTLDVDAGAGDDVVRAREAHLVYGGAGNDTLTADGPQALVLGGPGDDHLLGGRLETLMTGGGGNDRIEGGAGPDTIDGDGSDAISRPVDWGYYSPPSAEPGRTLAPGNDVIDGGPGRDTLDASTRRDDLRIDLGAGRLRGRHDRDRFASFERVSGGLGDDMIVGSSRADTLGGGSGRDVVIGRGGDDSLAGSGDDRLVGGTGDDLLTSPSPQSSCGAGDDEVDGDRSRLAPRDCERLFMGQVDVDPFHAAVLAGSMSVPVLVHNGSSDGSSTWTVRAGWSGRGAVLGRRDGDVDARASALVIALNARGRAYVAGGGRSVTVSHRVVFFDEEMGDDDSGPAGVLIASVR